MASTDWTDTQQALSELLEQHRLERVTDHVLSNLKEAIAIDTQRQDEELIPIGTSKLGGMPDLPANIAWPRWHDRPLAFVAQICLSELPALESRQKLPDAGQLYFFYDAQSDSWGGSPNDFGSWRVLHSDQENIARRPAPKGLDPYDQFANCSMIFRPILTIPSVHSRYIQPLELSVAESNAYYEFEIDAMRLLHRADDRPLHQLMGHPNEVQNEMQLDCQLVSNGIDLDTVRGYDDPRVAALSAGASEWELLFQIDSDDQAGMMWGDVGMLYFWITREQLSKRDFAASWMIFQCH